jgi:purine nucleoside phosphorylase
LSDRPLNHQEVLDMSNVVGATFERVVREFVRELAI